MIFSFFELARRCYDRRQRDRDTCGALPLGELEAALRDDLHEPGPGSDEYRHDPALEDRDRDPSSSLQVRLDYHLREKVKAELNKEPEVEDS